MVIREVRVGLFICFLVFSLFVSLKTEGCAVPVFRYALERWPADPYIITVFYRGKLSESEKRVIRYYKKFNKNYNSIIFSVINLDDKNIKKEFQAYWNMSGRDKLPAVVVSYPREVDIKDLAGVYPLDMQSAEQLMESPAGREIARRILKNDSSVFIQIDGADDGENKKSEKIVKSALKKMEDEIKLSNSEFPTETVPEEDAPKVKFSFMRISREDSGNRAFVDILLNSERGLNKIKGPIVFPVYGRARALFAFSGEGITLNNMLDAGTFLTGECSCEIKGENPGIDLLVPINWDDFIHYEVDIDEELPPLTGLASSIIEEKELEAPVEKLDLKKISKEDDSSSNTPLILNMLVVFIGLITVFAIIAISIRKKGVGGE
jgi:hypothetical protein